MKNTATTFRFSIRSFLAGAAIACIILAPGFNFYLFKDKQRETISKIESLSGFADTTDFYGSPETIRFDFDTGLVHSRRIQNSDGEFLATLKNVIGINLSYTSINDDMLTHLSKLTHLEWLNVERTVVSQNAINKLQLDLPNCEIYHDGRPAPRLGLRRNVETLESSANSEITKN